MSISDKIGDIDNFGINLKLEDEELTEFYCETLRQWLEEEKGYDTFIVEYLEFMISIDDHDICTIYIEGNILRFRSMCDDASLVVMDVLEFVAQYHRKTIDVYNYLDENDGEHLEIESEEEVEVESEESEEVSSDDWEWI